MINSIIKSGNDGPALLIPLESSYLGVDGVLLWREAGVEAGVWKVLLIQVTLSSRHSVTDGGDKVLTRWVERLLTAGVDRKHIGMLFGVAPHLHPA